MESTKRFFCPCLFLWYVINAPKGTAWIFFISLMDSFQSKNGLVCREAEKKPEYSGIYHHLLGCKTKYVILTFVLKGIQGLNMSLGHQTRILQPSQITCSKWLSEHGNIFFGLGRSFPFKLLCSYLVLPFVAGFGMNRFLTHQKKRSITDQMSHICLRRT